MNNKRLAFFIPALHSGGAEIVILMLAKSFIQFGYDVDLILARAEGPYLKKIPEEVNLVNLKSNSTFMALPALVRYLRSKKPCLIFSTVGNANVVAVLAKKMSGVDVKIILRECTIFSKVLSNTKDIRVYFYNILSRFTYPEADAIIAISQGVADDLFKRINLPSDHVHVIYNPVVSEDLIKKASEPVHDSWFTSGSPPVILSVGRLTKAKDYPMLLRAFALVRKNIPAHLVILGEGERRSALEQLIIKLDIAKDVKMPGFVMNPYKFMARATVFVLPSRWEGFGNVLVEAMACGVPVIATDCPGGPKEILAGGKYGILCPVGDENCLAKAILQVISNAKIYKIRGQIRSNDFTVKAISKEYLDLFRRILRS